MAAVEELLPSWLRHGALNPEDEKALEEHFKMLLKAHLDQVLSELERYRERNLNRIDFASLPNLPQQELFNLLNRRIQVETDSAIRVCEATIAKKAGYVDRMAWRHLQRIG